MKKSVKIGLGIGLAALVIYTIKQRFNDNPKVFSIKGNPNSRFGGITIPPLGIILNENVFGIIGHETKYRNNPMEQEAYIVAKQIKKVNPKIKPTNYSGLLT